VSLAIGAHGVRDALDAVGVNQAAVVVLDHAEYRKNVSGRDVPSFGGEDIGDIVLEIHSRHISQCVKAQHALHIESGRIGARGTCRGGTVEISGVAIADKS
jgi:hypothetical protein